MTDERRTEKRQLARVTCMITVLRDLERVKPPAMGCVVDFSPSGLGLVTAISIAPDTAVVVEYGGVLILAEVRSCVPDQKAFRIGLRVDQAMVTAAGHLSVSGAITEIQMRLAAEICPENALAA